MEARENCLRLLKHSQELTLLKIFRVISDEWSWPPRLQKLNFNFFR